MKKTSTRAGRNRTLTLSEVEKKQYAKQLIFPSRKMRLSRFQDKDVFISLIVNNHALLIFDRIDGVLVQNIIVIMYRILRDRIAQKVFCKSAVRILGAVLNKVKMSNSGYYGHYYKKYYGKYYSNDPDKNGKKRKKSR